MKPLGLRGNGVSLLGELQRVQHHLQELSLAMQSQHAFKGLEGLRSAQCLHGFHGRIPARHSPKVSIKNAERKCFRK